MEKYEVVKDIGSGNFGVARLMRNKETKELVAMKYIERGQKIDENVARFPLLFQYYNDMLLQSGTNGSVQSEILFHKDPEVFTFEDGWAFPRKMTFNGQDCVMPSPEDFPKLPKRGI